MIVKSFTEPTDDEAVNNIEDGPFELQLEE